MSPAPPVVPTSREQLFHYAGYELFTGVLRFSDMSAHTRMGQWTPDGRLGELPATVLLVDDDEDTRIIYSAILMRAGYRVLFAKDGEEAVSIAHHVVPDVVLMDLAMPTLDGYGARERLSLDPSTASVPVLALTGTASLHDVKGLAAAGFREVLLKPIKPMEVLRAVRRTLEASS
jgi:CheY-like chemotaxis protein